MWQPGQIVTIHERIPINGQFIDLARRMRVVINWGAHHCINCPLQQLYCDISRCEEMLPLSCTLKNLQRDSGESES